MNESDHVHYCIECEHWYLCKWTEFRREYISNPVTSHRKHIDSISIEDDKIKPF